MEARMGNIIKEYLRLKRGAKEPNPYRSPLELCSIQLDWLPLEDTFFIIIKKGGAIELRARDKEARQSVIIPISYAKIQTVLVFMKSHLPEVKSHMNSSFPPEIIFYFENFFVTLDDETKQLFRNIAKFLKMPAPVFCSNKFYLHLLCRRLAKTIMNYMIMQELYIFEHKISWGGYYWSLYHFKNALESELQLIL